MSEYEALREDMAELGKAIVGYQSATTRQLLEQSRQIGKLWTDNGALRDELHKAIVGYQSATTRHLLEQSRQLLEQSRQIGKLWTDNGALRDELHAVANRLENLTTFVTTAPAEVAAAIVNDANRSTLREVRGDDAK